MFNIKDVCCNPRLHDLVLAGWPPCCAKSFVVVIVVHCCHCWVYAPAIHATSHFDNKKRVAWVPIFMHTCGSFFYNNYRKRHHKNVYTAQSNGLLIVELPAALWAVKRSPLIIMGLRLAAQRAAGAPLLGGHLTEQYKHF